jgi:hypothetical protein
MTRDEHLTWAKDRALAELGSGGGGPTIALASIQSDFSKHPDLTGHTGLELMRLLAISGHLSTERQVREYVEGLQ